MRRARHRCFADAHAGTPREAASAAELVPYRLRRPRRAHQVKQRCPAPPSRSLPMPKNSYYYYDHEACTFVEVEPDRTRWLFRGGLVAVLVLAFATAGMWAVSTAKVTPAEI